MDFISTASKILGNVDVKLVSQYDHEGLYMVKAASKGNIKIFKQLHELGGNIYYQHAAKGSLLVIAASYDKNSVVKYLIEQGLDVNAACPKNGLSPLHFACRSGSFEIAKLLVDNNANVNQKTKTTKQTPLTLAMMRGSLDIVKLLISRGVNLEYCDRLIGDNHMLQYSLTALVMDYLLSLDEQTLDINHLNKYRQTLLHCKMINGSYPMGIVREYELDAGVDVNHKDIHGVLAIDCRPRGHLTSEWRPNVEKHIVKLIAAGLPVCEENREAVEGILEDYNISCEEEIEKMINNKISETSTSFYDVLTMDVHHLSIRLKFAGLDVIINKHKLKSDYPLYGGMLFYKLFKVNRRIKYVDELENYVEGVLCKLGLPYDFVRELWYYFSNVELKQLILQIN